MTDQQFQKVSFDEFNPPKIYAYSDRTFPNCLKVGYTTRQKAEQRVREQYPTKTPEQTWKIELEEYAVRENGTLFRDFDVHKALKVMGVRQINGEWFECDVQAVQAALISVKKGIRNREKRTLSFGMRPEQAQAVNQTAHYFHSFKQDAVNQGKAPRFLWNAKMHFGKTFATYQLAKKMGWKKLLILTFKPAVQDAWQEDLANHTDFEGWQFVAKDSNLQEIDSYRPLVCFGSFQDYLGRTKAGAIKPKNEWVHSTNWDCVVFDEYHYGAWRENAKDLFDGEDDKKEQDFAESADLKNFDEGLLPITTHHYLYLSGTPFRAIASGEFIEEQIFNWTYSDEQKDKAQWQETQGKNPYLSLPKMVMMTYQLPNSIRDVASKGEFNEFDLNLFFEAKGSSENAQFTYKNEVQKWLEFIRNDLPELTVDTLKLRAEKPPMPFSDTRLLGHLLHTFWFL
ncbi:GIY-YIG nuclease family protein, partial [Rodentibacter genomosp. 2]|uniref:GIY-YIG nuclease family protein n=1 Tax=Rodentibacter genomosp. 2 TaxID=1908266 RepID=UPI0015C40C28